jgi:hypothetical protein
MSTETQAYSSDEAVDQVEQAIGRIEAEVRTIERHYHDTTDWPGYDGDARKAVRLGHRLQACALNSRVDLGGDE